MGEPEPANEPTSGVYVPLMERSRLVRSPVAPSKSHQMSRPLPGEYQMMSWLLSSLK